MRCNAYALDEETHSGSGSSGVPYRYSRNRFYHIFRTPDDSYMMVEAGRVSSKSNGSLVQEFHEFHKLGRGLEVLMIFDQLFDEV